MNVSIVFFGLLLMASSFFVTTLVCAASKDALTIDGVDDRVVGASIANEGQRSRFIDLAAERRKPLAEGGQIVVISAETFEPVDDVQLILADADGSEVTQIGIFSRFGVDTRNEHQIPTNGIWLRDTQKLQAPLEP